jgi:UDP-N-acetylmuramoylalanine--D-glutamate ligase
MTWPAGKKVLVVGLGSSGEAAAVVLRGLGAAPVVIDSSDAPSRADAAEALEARGIEVRLGVLVCARPRSRA